MSTNVIRFVEFFYFSICLVAKFGWILLCPIVPFGGTWENWKRKKKKKKEKEKMKEREIYTTLISWWVLHELYIFLNAEIMKKNIKKKKLYGKMQNFTSSQTKYSKLIII